jgi:hypothetical protein
MEVGDVSQKRMFWHKFLLDDTMSVKIYAVRNRSSNEVYIGSTTKRLLCNRLAEHRADFKGGRGVASGNIAQCSTAWIELLEECESIHRKERERWWIRNTPNCVNILRLQTDEEKRAAMIQATLRWRNASQERIEVHARQQREYIARKKLKGAT